jgi:hypothetical protein
VVADHLDEDRLQDLVCIGVDEISYRRHHRYTGSIPVGGFPDSSPQPDRTTDPTVCERILMPSSADPRHRS